ncbi:hypothetical protein HYH03_004676 [Edaphochlamys debaryana]|uniref:Bulb-type lectin domain-containing protein n=1 Tax=Edaphochlamys debaryana TaxID=47281 RepID=A0A835YA27_9CHLO|nr:hypothetical protein HYH03_004676 [Edaphochlamys debaryana]|eukprot:KAG2497528.1 hypothetical protein HYH03_004676 [Edaphochlamys debaryana]
MPGGALNASAGCALRCGLYQPAPGGTGQDGFCNTIRSPSQRISFMLQASDGNLVLADRDRGKVYWASGTGIKNATDHVLYLTANGTWVLYGSGLNVTWVERADSVTKPAGPWISKQRSFPMNGGPDNGPYRMVVHDEGGWAEIVNVYGIPTWWTIPECPLRREANQSCSPVRIVGCRSHCGLYQGLSGSQEDGCNYWWSPTRTHALVLGGDGVLGLFRANGSSGGLFLGSPLWAAGTSLSGATNASFVLEPNGTWTLRGAGTGMPYGVRATSEEPATVGGSLSFPENAGLALGPFSLNVLDSGTLELRNGEGGVAWRTVPCPAAPSCVRAPAGYSGSDWCTHDGSTFFNAIDCGDDGPGSTDLACTDWFGGRWVMLSSQGCVSRGGFYYQVPVNVSWCPTAFVTPRSCPDDPLWCHNPGDRFTAADCDADGLLDAACVAADGRLLTRRSSDIAPAPASPAAASTA